MVWLQHITMFLLAAVMTAGGCSSSHEAELARARDEAEVARAEAAKAQAEAEAAKAKLPKPAKKPSGVCVQRDTEAQEFCKWLGVDADCFKFEGGWIAFWIEVEIDGKKTKYGENQGGINQVAVEHAPLSSEHPETGMPSGSLVWVRRTEDQREVWDIAFKTTVPTSDGNKNVSGRIWTPKDWPPRPSPGGARRVIPGDAEVILKEGKVVTLSTLLTVGEKESEIRRTAKLQCELLK